MIWLAHLIFLICGIAGGLSIFYFFRNDNAKKYYILGKGIVILYVGILYGAVACDYWCDIITYPAEGSLTMELLRIAAFSASLIFLTDVFMRDKT